MSVSIGKGVLVALALAQAFVMAGCLKIEQAEEASVTTLCGKFTFSVHDKRDATKGTASSPSRVLAWM